MFGIENLNSRITELEDEFVKAKEKTNNEMAGIRQEIVDLRNEITKTIDKLHNDFDAKIIEFHRQIADKYFSTLEQIFRFNKEISLINTLAQQVGEKDITQLKAALLQPSLEKRWAEKKLETGAKIEKSWGVKIVERRTELHNRILEMERQGQPFEKIAPLKAKLEELDKVIGDIK